MRREKWDIWTEKEYQAVMAFGFLPNVMGYVHDEDETDRPAMIVVPGGGYQVVSPSEGEIVALEFYRRGYNCFVLTYTTDILSRDPLGHQPMEDLSRAIRMIRKYAPKLHILENKLFLCGFSAGAHLCGCLCVHWRDIEDVRPALQSFSNRPDAAILSYPVITGGKSAHRGSFQTLLGKGCSHAELDYMSLEKQVRIDTPPCFLWQTADDDTVPVENSYLFAQALKAKGIRFAHHVFTQGIHGLSLANEVWANHEYGEQYTYDQTFRIVQKVKEGVLMVRPEIRRQLVEQFDLEQRSDRKMMTMPLEPNREAAIWPELADRWLKEV